MAKVIINKQALAKAMATASRFSSPRSPANYMQCVRIVVADGIATIEATGVHGRCCLIVPCSGGNGEFVVNCATFLKTVNLVSGDDIMISILTNKIRFCGDGPSVEIPTFTQWVGSETPKASSTFSMDASEFARCVGVCETIGSEYEVKFANGIRIVCEDGVAHFVSVISTCGAFAHAACECTDKADVVLARGGISAAKKFAESLETITLEASESRLVIRAADGSYASMLLEVAGTKPPMLSMIEKTWKSSRDWSIDKTGLSEFLRHTLVISSVGATGVWMIPGSDGVTCKYTGISDGTNSADMSVDATCEHHVSGDKCEGEPVYVSCKLLAPAISAMGDEDWKIRAVDRRSVIVETDNALIAVGQMAYPSKGVPS